MSIPSHLVNAKIEQARARGALAHPDDDETRTLAEIERLLAELPYARGHHAAKVRAELGLQERQLAHILERTGQSVLADVLWDVTPSYDLYG